MSARVRLPRSRRVILVIVRVGIVVGSIAELVVLLFRRGATYPSAGHAAAAAAIYPRATGTGIVRERERERERCFVRVPSANARLCVWCAWTIAALTNDASNHSNKCLSL